MTLDPQKLEGWDAIEAALRAEGEAARRTAVVPSAALVWWRAQLRARQEAARAVTRPIAIAQGLAVACSAGLALGIAGVAVGWARGALGAAFDWSSAVTSLVADPAVRDMAGR